MPYYDYLINLSEYDFLEEINKKLQSSSQENFSIPPLMTAQLTRRFGFHLTSSNLENYFSGGRVVFLGDSAHTVHPMLGQGLNLGIQDARVLGRKLERNLAYGLGLTAFEGLSEYENQAKLQNYQLQLAVEGVKVFYDSPWMENVRKLGTEFLDYSPLIREQLYKMANSI